MDTIAASGVLAIFWLIYLVVVVFELAAVWQMFTKAGEAGWQSIIPIWNTIVMLRIAGRPAWWFVLLILPIVNFVVWIVVSLDLAKCYGKGSGFGLGIAFLPFIFIPMLAFGDSQYTGSGGNRMAYSGAPTM